MTKLSIKIYFYVGILVVVSSCKTATQSPEATTMYIDLIDDELLNVIDTSTKIEILADGFNWSEGPLWLRNEQKLIFSDVPENKLYSWDEVNGKQLYLTPSGFTIADKRGGTEGANGIALDKDGNLILCQHGNRALAMMIASTGTPKDSFTYLATTYKNKKFNSPNDLYIAKNGDIYFTDPPYGLPGKDQDSIKEISFNGVFKWSNGDVILIDSTMTKPNGVVMSRDEKTLYVANSDPKEAYWRKYSLDENGNIMSTSEFKNVTELVDTMVGLPDGMKINSAGYIFATGPGGVFILHADGRHLGTIKTGQATANCALDADETHLYMTADDYLMRVKLKK